MAPAYVLDHYFLAITILVTTAYQLSGFAVAWIFQFDKITDFTGGSNFFLLALLTLLMGNTYPARNIVASIFVMIWAVRIAGFLFYRVLKAGSDTRFDDIRSHFFKFLAFWIGQIVWVWTVSLPLTILNSPAISDTRRSGSNPAFGTACDTVGIILWVVGWIVETTADIQKFRYKNKKSNPKDKPVTTGLWKWSRHPPYFGEILCWWGIFILCLSPTVSGTLPSSAKSAQYAAIVSPLFTMLLLMFASGIPTAEKPQAAKFFLMSHGPTAESSNQAWNNYKAYLNETSILIPIPPAVYKPIPRWLKASVLLDFPFYHFDEGKDGADAIESTGSRSN
ncbi:DUF1295-domain-containing protein [Guyanagaster necrorhizus]|uniref:DUF1295-domain-containing protein n=1 Tax=Guyanagaster necrorhizus TaxID=856835 RepID=A0A9P8AV43_9AGAR|nr:DUF1295-domain-containing protein [Guyanagaster necrorhizus MCA 3950]KAG7448731.1 DUF1295-domain-containing protein [Guyanagaster necrorhizus MCA 3950]